MGWDRRMGLGGWRGWEVDRQVGRGKGGGEGRTRRRWKIRKVQFFHVSALY